MGKVLVREEGPDDAAAIRDVQQRAFDQAQESDLVDALRANGAVLLSLVAVAARRIVGHVMYSPVSVGSASGAALGPMAVLPEHQRVGIGRALIEEGNRKLEGLRCPFVVVVGHPDYYPRFGFRPASEHGITCEWNVPDDVFMVLVLDPSRMRTINRIGQVPARVRECRVIPRYGSACWRLTRAPLCRPCSTPPLTDDCRPPLRS